MKLKRWLGLGSLILIMGLFIIWLAYAARPVAATQWTQKVDQWVLDTATTGQTEFLVYFKQQADLSGAAALTTKEAKGQYVYEQLTAVANQTQPALTRVLDQKGAAYRAYWVTNMIWVRGDASLIQLLANQPEVAHIYANPSVKQDIAPPPDMADLIAAAQSVEWNINHVNASDVWGEGFTGQGIVIGGQDTGYEWDHPALINQYRGWNGSGVSHDYNWHDAIHDNAGSNPCGFDSPEPCDDYGHGTHTMGTMVGDDGSSNQVGMAPGATWISCRNMDQGNGTPARYAECYEWFIAPTDLAGNNPDPAMAPHVINNSWSCPDSEGCTDPNVLLNVTDNVRAAGIVTVHSAGNSGSSCSSVNAPSAIYDSSFTVGSTNSSDNIASSSSRGPVTVDGSNRPKPDISAPGVGIRSTTPGSNYGISSGTSMAGPHVAGLVALLLSVDPSLAGQVDEIESIIQQTAVPLTTNQGCGSDTSSTVPNNVYGHGRIDAWTAYQMVHAAIAHELTIQKTAFPPKVTPGSQITYTLAVEHRHPTTATHNVIISDTLPPLTTLVTATQPYTQNGRTLFWELPSLAATDNWQGQLVVTVASTATHNVVNADYGVKSDQVTTVVTGPPVTTVVIPYTLFLQKRAPLHITPGEAITYDLTVRNEQSLAGIQGVTISDTLPAQTTFITATEPFTLSNGVITWQRSHLAADAIWAVQLVVAPESVPSIVNSDYQASSLETGSVSGLPVTTTIQPPTLELHKTAATAVLNGDYLTYTLTVTNPQPFYMATQLVLTDSLPALTTFITATQPVSANGRLLTWQQSSLAPQAVWQVQIVVQAPVTTTHLTLRNEEYGVTATDIAALRGPAVLTRVLPELQYIYLPFVSRSTEE